MRRTLILGLIYSLAMVVLAAAGLPAVADVRAADAAMPGVAPRKHDPTAKFIDIDGRVIGDYVDLQAESQAAALALGCTPSSGRDNPHRSSTGVALSAHGWWNFGTCKNRKADVLNCVYEWYTDRTWRNKACSPVAELAPGGGAGNRTTARINCSTTHLTSWRNHVNVDVKWEVDTNEVPYNQAEVNCRVP